MKTKSTLRINMERVLTHKFPNEIEMITEYCDEVDHGFTEEYKNSTVSEVVEDFKIYMQFAKVQNHQH